MRKIVLFSCFICFILSMTSCDALRKLVGRPTSSEIEQIKIQYEQYKENQKKMYEDSLRNIQQSYRDSLAVLDSLRQLSGTILNTSQIGGLFTTKLDYKYYIVIGAFKQRSSAEHLFQSVSKKGYKPTLISFRNGFNAVGLSPTTSLNTALSSLRSIKKESFCPDDVWILVNE